MSYESFVDKIKKYIEKSGISDKPEFNGEGEDQYTAWIPGEELLFSCSANGWNLSVRTRNSVYPIRVRRSRRGNAL